MWVGEVVVKFVDKRFIRLVMKKGSIINEVECCVSEWLRFN